MPSRREILKSAIAMLTLRILPAATITAKSSSSLSPTKRLIVRAATRDEWFYLRHAQFIEDMIHAMQEQFGDFLDDAASQSLKRIPFGA
jgi:hypothetical protein